MLGKLLKYDFKWINKAMIVYYIILALVSVSLKIVESMEQSLLVLIVDKALSSAFIGCVAASLITCIIRIWIRFINNIYRDESYLTHTLPVTKNQLFDSKIISGILSLLISGLVIVLCYSFIYVDKGTIESFKLMYQSLVEAYNSIFAVGFISGGILLVILEVIYLLMAGIFGIVVGFRSNNYKIIKALVVGIGSYGILSTVLLLIVSVLSKTIDYDIIGNGFPSMNYITVVGLSALFIYFIYNIGYYLIARKLLSKGVNID